MPERYKNQSVFIVDLSRVLTGKSPKGFFMLVKDTGSPPMHMDHDVDVTFKNSVHFERDAAESRKRKLKGYGLTGIRIIEGTINKVHEIEETVDETRNAIFG